MKKLISILSALFITLSIYAQKNPAVPCDPQDSLALVALYNYTNGDSWTNNSGWLTDSVYKWYGITINSEGRVTGIDLHNNNLTGQIPNEIGNLDKLLQLNLSQNSLSDTIPNAIGNLIELRTLYLYENQLSGPIPKKIYDLTMLNYLNLSNNNLSSSISNLIGNLTNLYLLNLSNNQLFGQIPYEIGNLTHLVYLSLSNNQFTGSIPESIGNLIYLHYLNLANNQLTGNIPQAIGNLSYLQYLYLSQNQLTGPIPDTICNLHNLYKLFLFNNQLSGQLPEQIGNLDSLQMLLLYSNNLSGSIPQSIGNLSKLEYLALNGNNFTGSIPATLGNLTNLQSLYLNYNQLTGNSADLSGLSNLQKLFVDHNKLDFGDLDTMNVNWSNLTQYSYSPQANVPVEVVFNNENVTISVHVDGLNNQYTWYKNSQPLTGNNSPSITVTRSDTGNYYCEITNSNYPDLILSSETYHLTNPEYNITFVVTDSSAPVSQAIVTLDTQTIETDTNGIAVFQRPYGTYSYTVEKQGYQTVSGTITVDTDTTINIILVAANTLTYNINSLLKLYPIPASNSLSIEAKSPLNEITISNLTGKVLLHKSANGYKTSLDLSNLQSGTYIITVRTEKGTMSYKFIKQ